MKSADQGRENVPAGEERYRLAVRAFHGAPYESHLDTGYGFRDPRAYEMLGLRPEEGEATRESCFIATEAALTILT